MQFLLGFNTGNGALLVVVVRARQPLLVLDHLVYKPTILVFVVGERRRLRPVSHVLLVVSFFVFVVVRTRHVVLLLRN